MKKHLFLSFIASVILCPFIANAQCTVAPIWCAGNYVCLGSTDWVSDATSGGTWSSSDAAKATC